MIRPVFRLLQGRTIAADPAGALDASPAEIIVAKVDSGAGSRQS
jgi:hypothetical protein